MSKLYIVTLEKLEQRYTKQWHKYFKDEFSKFFEVSNIDGHTTTDVIKKGRFLDINNTNKWKADQVNKIANLFNRGKIKDGDTFLFTDGWNYAITATKYMAQLNNIKIKMYAFWHAGTWDNHDFITQAGMRDWASFVEYGWLKALDGNFVATEFHKSLIRDYFTYVGLYPPNNIHVIGFPMNWKKEIEPYISEKKENIIVFPHRLDKEKNPKAFDILAKRFKNYQFIKTLEVTKNKKEYYKLIGKAKVVFSGSYQETFGIGTVESVICGAIPVIPDKLSYVDLYDKIFRYSNIIAAESKIRYALNHYSKSSRLMNALKRHQEKFQENGINAIPKMAEVMLK